MLQIYCSCSDNKDVVWDYIRNVDFVIIGNHLSLSNQDRESTEKWKHSEGKRMW